MPAIHKEDLNSTLKRGNAEKQWLVLLFFSLVSIGIFHHEMWRDELSIILLVYSTLIFMKIWCFKTSRTLIFLFLACVWISTYYLESKFLINRSKDIISASKSIKYLMFDLVDRSKQNYLTGILFVHVIAGIFAFSMDLNYTFSGSKEVANYITQQGLQNYLLLGSRDYAASPVTAFLNQKIYYVESDKVGTFIVWKNRKLLNQREVIEQVERLIKQNKKALLILNYKLTDERPDLNISLMFKSNRSIVPDETYYLYMIQKKLV